MTRTFSDGHPKVLPACNFLSQYYFYNVFLQKSCRFSLQTLAKFEATKTGSGVGFLRLTAVWVLTKTSMASENENASTQRSNVSAYARIRKITTSLASLLINIFTTLLVSWVIGILQMTFSSLLIYVLACTTRANRNKS